MKRIESIATDIKEGVISLELTPDSDINITLDDIVKTLKKEGYPLSTDEIEVSYKEENGKRIITVYRYVKKDIDYLVEETFFGKLDKNLLVSSNGDAKRILEAIGYTGDFRLEGVSDENGDIDSYAIYLIKRTALQEDQDFSYEQAVPEKQVTIKASLSLEERIAILNQDFEEIKALRAELESIKDEDARKKQLDLISEKVTSLDKKITSFESIIPYSTAMSSELADFSEDAATLLRTNLKELDEKIQSIERHLDKKLEQYNDLDVSQTEEGELPDTDEKALEDEEEQLSKLSSSNDQAAALEREVSASQKKLAAIKKEKAIKEADLMKAEALHLTVEEYLEISNAVGRKKIEEAIMSQKGIADIYNKPDKERTPEEREALQSVKNEILREIHEKQQADNVSVFEAIQLLYHLELKFSKGTNPRVISVTQNDIDGFHQTSTETPSKVVRKDKEIDYIPGKAPEGDLEKAELPTIELLLREKVENMFREDSWVKDHLQEQEGLEKELAAKEQEYSHAEAERQRTPLSVFSSDLEKIEKEIAQIKAELSALDTEFANKKVEIRSSLEKEIADRVEDLYSKDSKVQDYLQQQKELEKELAAKEQEYSHAEAERQRTPLSVFPSDLEKIEKEITKIKNEISTLEKELIKRRKIIEKSVIEELARESIQETITLFQDENGKIYTREYGLEKFELTPSGNAIRINGIICYPITEEDANRIIDMQNEDDSSYKVIIKKIRKIDKEKKDDVSHGEQLDSTTYIKSLLNYISENNISIYKYYVELAKHYREDPNYVPEEFEQHNPFLNEEHYKALREGQEERLPQYFAILMRSEIEKHLAAYQSQETGKDDDKEPEIDDQKAGLSNDPSRGTERITLYRDIDNNNDIYASQYILTRFDIEPISDGISLDRGPVFKIDPEDFEHIMNHKDTADPPYIIEIMDTHLNQGKDNPDEEPTKDKKTTTDEEPIKDKKANTVEKTTNNDEGNPVDGDIGEHDTDSPKEDDDKDRVVEVPLFRITNDNNKIYAPLETLEKFGLSPNGNSQTIAGLECYFVNEETEEHMKRKAENSTNPKLHLKYIDIELKKEKPKGRLHYQKVIQKITAGLDNLSAKGARRFNESKVMVAENFVLDTHSGNMLYNVIGFAPAALKVPLMKFIQLRGRLSMFIKPEVREDYEELVRRLDDLSDEELESVFEDYRGSNVKADMNLAINSIIAARMRRYVKEKIEQINTIIKMNYVKLFNYLKEIETLDEQLTRENIGEAEKEQLIENRKVLMRAAALNAQTIDYYRNMGINLLSGGGLHGFEEDMKATDSKMSYVGYRFAKTGEFDHETQQLLAEFGQGFNNAVAAGDDEEIIRNFMGYEACYSDNTEIRNSIFGRRSVGTKYYTPLVEEFDYRDDPFIRNLLSTIAITSATISAVNALRVKAINDQSLIAHNKKVAGGNENNMAVESQAHQVGHNIEGQRQTMIDGMQSRAMHDANEAAGISERGVLDLTSDNDGWRLGSPEYIANDETAHDFYNGFYEDISGRLNDVAARYSSGGINQSQALEEIASIANDSQSTLNSIINEYLPSIRSYAQNHPEFDLRAFEESMTYIVEHQNAITDMNNGIVDIMRQAETLSTLSVQEIPTLSEIASDLPTTLASAASAVALAFGVSKNMVSLYGKGRYGNEVTDMMSEYLYGNPEEEEETVSHRR